MTRRLIGLPLELGLRAVRLGLRAVRLPLDLLGAREGGAEPAPSARAAKTPAPPPPAPPRPAATNGAGAIDAPAHVSEEAEVVAEFAEAGAEDGAHAEMNVAEPWEGYDRMTVRDVEQRLATATAEEIAVVSLYESTHKRRESVLRATERRMKHQAAERRRPG